MADKWIDAITLSVLREACLSVVRNYSQWLLGLSVTIIASFIMPTYLYPQILLELRPWLILASIIIIVLFILRDIRRRLMAWWTNRRLEQQAGTIHERLAQLRDDQLLMLHTFTIYEYLMFDGVTQLLDSLIDTGFIGYVKDVPPYTPKGKLALRLIDDDSAAFIKLLVHKRYGSRESVDIKSSYPEVYQFELMNKLFYKGIFIPGDLS